MPRVSLVIEPSDVERVFHKSVVVIDGGKASDYVDAACKFYLLWRSEFPWARHIHLEVEGMSDASAVLTTALFRQPRAAS